MTAQKTVQGTPVTTVKIGKADYVTVAERSRVAHETCGENDIGGYEIIGENVFETNGRFFMTVQIRVNGKPYFGTSEIRFNAKAGTADATAPMECAETSAVGRALAFAGFGALDSIASAEEVERATGQTVRPQTSSSQTTSAMATPEQLTALRDLAKLLEHTVPEGLTYNAAQELGRKWNTEKKARQGVASNA